MDQEETPRRTTNLTDSLDGCTISWYEPTTKVRQSFRLKEYNIAPRKPVEPCDKNVREPWEKKDDKCPNNSAPKTANFYNSVRTKPTVVNLWTKEDEHRTVKIPQNFPGTRILGDYCDTESKEDSKDAAESQSEEQPRSKLTLEDMEKVLSPRRDGKSRRVKNRNVEKLPKIRTTKEREKPRQAQPGSPVLKRASQHFNFARMMTELNEICQMKDDSVVTPGEKENVLTLKTVQDARRYSAFIPRLNNDRPRHHTRCRSLPNIDTEGFPKRYFVKLDPVRASAIPVNLSARNNSSQRCRIGSENLRKLNEHGIEPSESERKALIGEWIRETTQVGACSRR